MASSRVDVVKSSEIWSEMLSFGYATLVSRTSLNCKPWEAELKSRECGAARDKGGDIGVGACQIVRGDRQAA